MSKEKHHHHEEHKHEEHEKEGTGITEEDPAGGKTRTGDD